MAKLRHGDCMTMRDRRQHVSAFGVGFFVTKGESMAVTKFAQHGLVRLGYEMHGEGEPAVLVLHGLLQTRNTLGPLLDELEDRATVIAMDLRAHGGSSTVQGLNLRLEHLVEDAFAVLDSAEVDGPAIVVGVGVGAIIADAMKQSNPDRVVGTVLVNYPDGEMLDEAVITNIADTAYKGQAEQAVSRWLDLSWGAGWNDAMPKSRIAAARRSAEAIHPILMAIAKADVQPQDSISLPGGSPFEEEKDLASVIAAIEAIEVQ